ncbi:hypothetical protein L9W97_13065 [Vibrio aestuarianus]|uniref:hypothetical protein n=1 Tax=Vibrio aestuarianus TaxID=28171 RepID=UPI00237CD67D|nr:hypothetical protein [Vibrio aestuarianus]MDE1326063.1 hypothetical protein [Vibrio aestuarianus]MDE1333975.1 hypothetical protein [Vibrio aestuarianus]
MQKSLLTLTMRNKMKTKILGWCLLVISLNVQGSQSIDSNSKWFKPYGASYDSSCLLEAYEKIEKKIDLEKNNRLFMDCFPKNFDRFVDIFGYQVSSYFDVEKGSGFLAENEKSPDIIGHFFEVSEHDENIDRILFIGVNGFWQLDNVGVYQYYLRDFIKNNQSKSFKFLDNLSQRDLDSFWFFFFDGRYSDKNFPNFLKKNEFASKRILDSAAKAYENSTEK